MTDQADTGPIDLDGIRARWSRNGGMGNDRGDEDYNDAGCRILARAAFRDFPVLDAEVRALRAERDRAFTERDIADATRIRLVAELAAARDQIAAVLALHYATPDCACADAKTQCAECGGEWPCDTAAALSQSGQPTKETDHA